MWTYRQASGVLDHDGAIVGVGYSGSPEGKNNPSKQNIPCVGPVPQGEYGIHTPAQCNADLAGGKICVYCGGVGAHKHGPFVLRLNPDPANEMFGRSGFLIHGDSIERPGCASEGCIIMPRDVRERVAASADNRLTVAA